MKNSNRYLLAAVMVLLASLTAYNMALHTEYRKGTYKDPLHGYTTLSFQNFQEVAVPAASSASVKIVAGPFGVRVNPRAAEYIHVSQQGPRLLITANFPEAQKYLGRAETVVISCPRLTSLTTDALYQEHGKPVADKQYAGGRRVLVQGFRQDSLTVRADRASRVELAGTTLGYLHATTGATPGSHSGLQLNADTHVAAAKLALGHQSELVLLNTFIPLLHHQLADSVKVTLTGAALGSLAK